MGSGASVPDVTGLWQALEKFNVEKDVAAHIKREFDKKHNPTWHCIVGRNFGDALPASALAGSSARKVPPHVEGCECTF